MKAHMECRALQHASPCLKAVPVKTLRPKRTARPLRVLASARPEVPQITERDGTFPLLASLRRSAQHIGSVLATSVCAAALLLSPPALAEPSYIRVPAASDPAIFAAQRTLLEAWTVVGNAFYDVDFNNHDWADELKTHMLSAYQAPSGDDAFGEIEGMLKDLGDPYTRRLPPSEYAEFRASSDGSFEGVGLLLTAQAPADSHLLRVIEPIKGGPADRAGVLPGDKLLSVNDQSAEDWTAEQAAKVLRGNSGSEVRVKLARRTSQIPGVPGRPEPRVQDLQIKEVNLRREAVVMSPLYATTLQDGPSRHLGYMRLTSFSSNAAQEMRRAVQRLQAEGADEYILDLRSNPGGLVDASIDMASMWMDGQPTVFTVSGRPWDPVMRITPETPSRALTDAPLVVLVNEDSASASEILSGALHDHQRATIVGDHATYGKGKIQSVFELQDGSALLVTVARYKTPAGEDIDHRGITPDRSCGVPLLASVDVSEEEQEDVAALGSTLVASTFQPGLPAGPGSEEALAAQLAADRCVLAAERVFASGRGRSLTAQHAPNLVDGRRTMPSPATAHRALL